MNDNTVLLELLREINQESEAKDVMRACKIAASTVEALQAEVDQLESNYLVVNFGHGTIEVAEGISEGTYALMLGNGGSGVVGEDLQGDRHMTKHETLAVLKFHSLASIDVVLSRLNRLRQRMINHEPVEIKNDSGEVVEIVTPKLKEQSHD